MERRKHRLVFVRDSDEHRHPKEDKLIVRAEAALVRRRLVGFSDLAVSLRASLTKVVEDERVLTTKTFDAAPTQLTLNFIDATKVEEFRTLAENRRVFRLVRAKNTKDALIQLNLFDDDRPNNAAMLLFSDNPERVAPGAEIKCAHYAGTAPPAAIFPPSLQKRRPRKGELNDGCRDVGRTGTRSPSSPRQTPIRLTLKRPQERAKSRLTARVALQTMTMSQLWAENMVNLSVSLTTHGTDLEGETCVPLAQAGFRCYM